MYICIYIYICIYVYIYICIYIYIYICIYNIHVYMYTHTHTHTYIYIYMYIYTHMHTKIHINKYISHTRRLLLGVGVLYIYICMYTCIYTHIYTHMHIKIYIHKYSSHTHRFLLGVGVLAGDTPSIRSPASATHRRSFAREFPPFFFLVSRVFFLPIHISLYSRSFFDLHLEVRDLPPFLFWASTTKQVHVEKKFSIEIFQ